MEKVGNFMMNFRYLFVLELKSSQIVGINKKSFYG